MSFLKNNIILRISNLKNFLFIFLFTCSIYLWSIQIYKIDLRHLVILLIFPVLYNMNFKRNDIFLLIIVLFLFIQKLPYVNKDEILYNLILFIYLIILAKVIKEFYQFFLKNINSHINIFLTIFIALSILISFYYLIFFNRITTPCLVGCFSMYKIFYLENSHLGMMASSLILYSLFLISINKNQNQINLKLLLTFILICLLNYSLTFHIGLIFNSIFLLLFFWKKINNKFVIYLILISVICSLFIFNNKIYLNKIFSIIEPVKLNFLNKISDKKNTLQNLSKEKGKKSPNLLNQKNINSNEIKNFDDKIGDKIIVNKNLSSEVYLKSIKIAIKSAFNYPLGVGLNNYEFSHEQYIDDIDLNFHLTKLLNKQDASFNLPKIISEFGILSLFFFYVILKFTFSKKIEIKYKIFLLPNILTQLFFRGAGYFNGGFIIFVLIITFLVLEKNENR